MFVRSSSYEALQFSEAQALKPVSAMGGGGASARGWLVAALLGGSASTRAAGWWRRCSAAGVARRGVGERAAGRRVERCF